MKKILLILGFVTGFSFNGYSAPLASIDTGNWMEQLRPSIEDKPITQIFIPGSHDSATYKLEHKFGKKQDISDQLNKLRFIGVGFAVTKIAQNWAKAQDRTIAQQLADGIRFLDLRIIYRDSKKSFYLVHGLYGPSLDDVLAQIDGFLKQHPKEIIIIQVGDLNYMPHGAADHQALIQKFVNKFGDRLVPKKMGLDKPIKQMWEAGKQVILIYNKSSMTDKSDVAFPRSAIDSYWTNSTDLNTLKTRLDKNLSKRHQNPNQVYVIQSQMTPSNDTIASALKPFSKGYKSLDQMAVAVHKVFPQWLATWSHEPAVIILDFVNSQSSRQIIALNIKQNPEPK